MVTQDAFRITLFSRVPCFPNSNNENSTEARLPTNPLKSEQTQDIFVLFADNHSNDNYFYAYLTMRLC